jgi:hypothetical protein
MTASRLGAAEAMIMTAVRSAKGSARQPTELSVQ